MKGELARPKSFSMPRDVDEILQHGRAVRRHDGFRMELDAIDLILLVLNSHDLSVVRARRDRKALRHASGISPPVPAPEAP